MSRRFIALHKPCVCARSIDPLFACAGRRCECGYGIEEAKTFSRLTFLSRVFAEYIDSRGHSARRNRKRPPDGVSALNAEIDLIW